MNAASVEAGLATSWLGLALGGKYDDSKHGPGIFSIQRIAEVLGTSASYLLGEDKPEPQNEKAFLNGIDRERGIVERLLENHFRGSGHVDAMEDLLEHCDLYELPEAHWHSPVGRRVGSKTLLATRLGNTSAENAQREIEAMAMPIRRDALTFHRKTAEEGMAIGHAVVNHPMVTRPHLVLAANARLGLLKTDHNGEQCLLVHAMAIPS